MSKRLASFAALASALIAVSLLLLQPICEAEESHLAQGESCYVIGPAAPAQAASAADEEPRFAILEATAGLPAFRPSMLARIAPTSAPAIPVPRYHARSARIQR